MNIFDIIKNLEPTDWIAIWGAFLATILAIKEIILLWRNRSRVEFQIYSATCYFEIWKQFQIDDLPDAPGPPGTRFDINERDYKRTFVVLEFIVKNYHPSAKTIGRFQIDNWMFMDRYTPEMDAPQRDYRVFDLHSREDASLEDSRLVEPGGLYGLRVEILDEIHDSFVQMRSRKKVNLPKSYDLKFRSDDETRIHEVEIRTYEEQYYWSFEVNNWSDLIPSVEGISGAPKPQ